jgi:K+-sensing histidine kinase KdpD
MRTVLNSCLGISACAGVAVLLSMFLGDSTDARLVAPSICLQVVIAATLYWGRMAGLIGAVAATVIFELLLFPPLGRFAVSDPTERAVLISFQLAAIGVVLMSPRSPGSGSLLRTRPRHKPSGAFVRELIRQRDSR